MSSDTSTPLKAREHARAQAAAAAAKVKNKPTIPPTSATNLPPHVRATDVIWDETLAAGEYASHVLPRGSRLLLTDLEGDACANVLVYNADLPTERLNVADTIKVQWNGYLGRGKMLLSDMGRVLMSITQDTAGHHDTFCGGSNPKTNAAKYGGDGGNYSPHPSARDRFLLAVAKHGFGKRDVMPSISLFKGVKVLNGGGLQFVENSSKPGATVELRAEMNVLVVIANTPHVLDPRTTYIATPLRLTAQKGEVAKQDDPIRLAAPENERAFENVDDYFLSAAQGV